MAYLDVKYKEPMFPHQKYEDRLVAFIDVLGFSNLVDDTKGDEQKLQHLTAALDALYNRIWEWEADGVNSSFAFTQFSDSIVISALAESSDSFEMLQQLLLGVMELVDDYDILVRGGIARGQLIHDRTMVVGPGRKVFRRQMYLFPDAPESIRRSPRSRLDGSHNEPLARAGFTESDIPSFLIT